MLNFYLILYIILWYTHKFISVFWWLEDSILVAPSAQTTVLSPEAVKFLLGTGQTTDTINWPDGTIKAKIILTKIHFNICEISVCGRETSV
jgi:hypothetical protein